MITQSIAVHPIIGPRRGVSRELTDFNENSLFFGPSRTSTSAKAVAQQENSLEEPVRGNCRCNTWGHAFRNKRRETVSSLYYAAHKLSIMQRRFARSAGVPCCRPFFWKPFRLERQIDTKVLQAPRCQQCHVKDGNQRDDRQKTLKDRSSKRQ